jgi:hypothetical protein
VRALKGHSSSFGLQIADTAASASQIPNVFCDAGRQYPQFSPQNTRLPTNAFLSFGLQIVDTAASAFHAQNDLLPPARLTQPEWSG